MNAAIIKWAQLMALEDRLVERIRRAAILRDFERVEELKARREGILMAIKRTGWKAWKTSGRK